MFKQKIFITSFLVLVIVAIFHYIGIKYYLYWTVKWYDIPMHILGGLWVSLLSLSIYAHFYGNASIINYRRKVFKVVFLVLLFVTVSWEVFELIGKITFLNDKGYWLDTFKDIFDGYIGGMIGYFFFIRNKKCKVELVSTNNKIIHLVK